MGVDPHLSPQSMHTSITSPSLSPTCYPQREVKVEAQVPETHCLQTRYTSQCSTQPRWGLPPGETEEMGEEGEPPALPSSLLSPE